MRTILTAVLALVFLFSTAMFLRQQREEAAGSSIYSNALVLATSGKPAKAQTQNPPTTEPASVPAEPRWVVAAPEEEDPHI